MANALNQDSIIDWEAVGEITDLGEVVRLLPPARVIQILGVERAIQAIGLQRVIEATGAEKVLDELFATVPKEQLQEMLRRRQQE